MDKWLGKGKQTFIGRVNLEIALKYGKWCVACGHVFCPIKGQLHCLKKHTCDDVGLQGPFSLLNVSLAFASKMTKSFKITKEKLHCAKAFIKNWSTLSLS
jgi:hypothetical protein